MKIVYFANPGSVHDCKWINHFASMHDVVVVTQQGNNNERDLLKAEYEPILAPFSLFNRSRIRNTISEIGRIVGDDTDVIHSMYAMPNAIWADLARKNTPHVVTTRGSDVLVEYAVDYKKPAGLSQKISYPYVRHSFAKALRNADFVTSTSIRQRAAVREIRGGSENTEVIRTGVDESLFEFSPKDTKPFVFFCPRSMKPLYNLDILVKAFDEFVEVIGSPEYQLWLIDDQPGSEYSREIRTLVNGLYYKDQIEILGPASQKEMIERYKDCDVVVMIPKSDGTPVSGIEAMMVGRPLILGPLDYDSDLFSEETAWKAGSFEVKSIIDSMLEVALTDELRRRTDEARKVAVSNAGLSSSLKRVAAIYEDVTEGKR